MMIYVIEVGDEEEGKLGKMRPFFVYQKTNFEDGGGFDFKFYLLAN